MHSGHSRKVKRDSTPLTSGLMAKRSPDPASVVVRRSSPIIATRPALGPCRGNVSRRRPDPNAGAGPVVTHETGRDCGFACSGAPRQDSNLRPLGYECRIRLTQWLTFPSTGPTCEGKVAGQTHNEFSPTFADVR
jgi:hypothetical protein